jgi:uncharacterized membrane protein YkvI
MAKAKRTNNDMQNISQQGGAVVTTIFLVVVLRLRLHGILKITSS